jgi:two-component system, chemotaxis family, CheB/CheR fusion protein
MTVPTGSNEAQGETSLVVLVDKTGYTLYCYPLKNDSTGKLMAGKGKPEARSNSDDGGTAAGNAASTHTAPTHVVAIGASAGGLEAIEAFFAKMPVDNTFGFIVVQHLSPDYKSLMVEILSKKTTMPVQRAEDGAVVEAARIYLIPPRKNLTIFHGTLILSDQEPNRGINLPIDILLRSLAEDQGERAVAVILSGSGSDGMRGVRAVKQAGGMIMVQDESTARFDSMPRAAISTGLADFILPPAEMPQQLLAFTRHPYVARKSGSDAVLPDDDALTRIFALLRERSKVDFTYYKPSTVVRRIERRIGITQTDDIEAYVRHLHQYPAEVTTLFRELLIGVTSFFRDFAVFERLQEELLPSLIESAGNREMRVWIAGCSTGEEAYTMAILLRECMGRMDVVRDVKIFATDIDRDAVRFAATGIYPESIAADIPPGYLGKYFIKQEEHFQICRPVREMVVFAQHNLIKDPPFTRMDLVSCRNLLIYLQPVLQNHVLDNFSFSLRSEGILVLGTSESTGEMSDQFEVVDARLKLYRSRGRASGRSGGHSGASDRSFENDRGQPGDTRFRELQNRYAGARRAITEAEDHVLERFLEAAGAHYLPTAVVVDEHLQIQRIVGNSEEYFRIPSGKPTTDISRVALPELTIPLTTGAQKVFREQRELRYTGIRYRRNGVTIAVDLRIVPLPDRKRHDPLVAVFFSRERGTEGAAGADDTGRDDARRNDAGRGAGGETDGDADGGNAAPATYDVSREAEQRIQDLEQELQLTRENLQATVEELETSNEELQATNEELLASNEELQSTNEELHSTNEELYTVNTEYQNRIMELTELNNDVENLLTSSRIGTLLLDENLDVRRFSPQVTSIFGLRSGDTGRPIAHVTHNLVDIDPVGIMKGVQDDERVAEQEVRTVDGAWYLMRVIPYSVAPDVYSGVVASFVDITSLKEAQKLFETIADASPALIWISGLDKQCTWFNRPWLNFTGRTMEQEMGAGWTEGVHPDDYDRCLATYTEAFDRRKPFTMEYRLRRRDGVYRWILDEGHPRFGSDGAFEGYIGSCLDIEDQKTSQERMRRILVECEEKHGGCDENDENGENGENGGDGNAEQE